jgi:hypothetical protein
VEIGESQTFLCDLIDIGGANLASKTAHVGEAEIVGDDNEEVGAFSHDEGSKKQAVESKEAVLTLFSGHWYRMGFNRGWKQCKGKK